MLCSECGYKNLEGVNFCKNCGANFNPTPIASTSPWIVGFFLAAIALITVIGFVGPMVMIAELSGKNLDHEPLMAMAFFFLAATTVVDWLLIRLLTRLLGFSKVKSRGIRPPTKPQPKYVTSEQSYPGLPESPISRPSVTEHTTRNFEPLISTEPRNRETS